MKRTRKANGIELKGANAQAEVLRRFVRIAELMINQGTPEMKAVAEGWKQKFQAEMPQGPKAA